ncbi:MAG: hypothetical protein FWC26_05190 [Fibromonadales bacterium]|nr:hypothetical protein [Fibromonadales bacterium]
MSVYSESLAKSLQEKIAFFKSANLSEEAELLQKRLNSLAEKPAENTSAAVKKIQAKNPIIEITRNNLQTKLASETRRIPELEKQYILKSASKAKTLKELESLQIAYIERLLKIRRASCASSARAQDFAPLNGNTVGDTGPYNNEKAFSDALQLIYSQDPLWIEDFKELYFSILNPD